MRGVFGAMFCLLIGALGMIVVTSILNGFVLVKLWGWFVVPAFGLPTLSIPVAIGISLIIKYLTIHRSKTAEDVDMWEAYKFAISFPIMTLIIGWIIHFFV